MLGQCRGGEGLEPTVWGNAVPEPYYSPNDGVGHVAVLYMVWYHNTDPTAQVLQTGDSLLPPRSTEPPAPAVLCQE